MEQNKKPDMLELDESELAQVTGAGAMGDYECANCGCHEYFMHTKQIYSPGGFNTVIMTRECKDCGTISAI